MRKRIVALLSGFSLVAISCGGLSGASTSESAVIGSETVPLSQAATDQPDGDDDGRTEVEGDGGAAGGAVVEAGEDGAVQSAGTPTELSTDPDIVYPPDTCYQPAAEGQVAKEVDCSTPHTVEVYAVRDLPGDEGAPFLGLDDAVALCNEDFIRITGVGIGLATVFRRSVLRPSEETWTDGERDVTCFVVYPELTDQRLSDIDPVRSFDRVSLYGLQVGDCLPGFDDEATTFSTVECTEPHDAEVFVDEELPPGPYPGDEAIETQADELCFGPAFEEFVGVDYANSSVFSLRSRPSAETWVEGDRTINCILTDETTRTESFRDSGL